MVRAVEGGGRCDTVTETIPIALLILVLPLPTAGPGAIPAYSGRLYAVDVARGDLLAVIDHRAVRLHPGWKEWQLRECWEMTQESKIMPEEAGRGIGNHRHYLPWAEWCEGSEATVYVFWKMKDFPRVPVEAAQ